MESGSALNPWAWTPPDLARKKAFNLGEKVGCKKGVLDWIFGITDDELLTCMQKVDPTLLARSQEEALTLGVSVCPTP